MSSLRVKLRGRGEHEGPWALRHAELGRPVGYADTPLDDQQAMQGLHQTNCFMLLLDDAQCNKNTGMLDDALLLDDAR